jgi:hypothetical protein
MRAQGRGGNQIIPSGGLTFWMRRVARVSVGILGIWYALISFKHGCLANYGNRSKFFDFILTIDSGFQNHDEEGRLFAHLL